MGDFLNYLASQFLFFFSKSPRVKQLFDVHTFIFQRFQIIKKNHIGTLQRLKNFRNIQIDAFRQIEVLNALVHFFGVGLTFSSDPLVNRFIFEMQKTVETVRVYGAVRVQKLELVKDAFEVAL